MLKVFGSRRRLMVAAVILLAGGVIFEEWHRAGTLPAHHLATKLTDKANDAGTEFLMTNKNFAAGVDLWRNSAVRTPEAGITYANFLFQSDLHISPADFDRLATRATDGKSHAPLLTLADKDITYALFSIGSFKATLNLTPVRAKPEDLVPTQIKPGVGGSFDF